MALTVTQKGYWNSGDSSSPSVTGLTISAGSTIVIVAAFNSGSVSQSVVYNDGSGTQQLTYHLGTENDNNAIEIWSLDNADAASGSGSVTVNFDTSNDVILVVYELTDTDSSGSFDKSASATGRSTDPDSGNTATTSLDDEVVIGGITYSDDYDWGGTFNGTCTENTINLISPSTTSNSLDCATKIISSAAAVNISKTGVSKEYYAAVVATFKASSGQSQSVDETLTFTEEFLLDLDSLIDETLAFSEELLADLNSLIDEVISFSEEFNLSVSVPVDESLGFSEQFDFDFGTSIDESLVLTEELLANLDVLIDETITLAEELLAVIPGQYLFRDNFSLPDDTAPRSDIWSVQNSGNATVLTNNNKLRIYATNYGAAQSSYTDSRGVSTPGMEIEGDFEIIFPWSWTYSGTTQRTLLFRVHKTGSWVDYAQIDLTIGQGYRLLSYNAWVNSGGDPSYVSSSDASGIFKVQRSGSTITFWYWNESQSRFEWDGDTDGYSWSIDTGDAFVRFGCYLGSDAGATIDIDYFQITYADGLVTWLTPHDALEFVETLDATIGGAQQTADVDESLTFTEDFGFGFGTTVEDSLTLTEELLASLDSLLDEAISLSEQFDFDFGTTVEDSFTFTEQFDFDFGTTVEDSLTFAEQFDFDFGTTVEDSLTFAEQFDFDFGTTVEDSLTFSELLLTTAAAGVDEAFALSEDFSFSYSSRVDESITLAEGLLANLNSLLDESVTLAEVFDFGFGTTVTDSFAFTEELTVNLDSLLDEAISLSEQFDFDFSTTVVDSLTFTEDLVANLDVLLDEAITFAEEFAYGAVVGVGESLTFSDTVHVYNEDTYVWWEKFIGTNGADPDTDVWSKTLSTGGTIQIQNNKLRFTSPSDIAAQANYATTKLPTGLEIGGDFLVKFDFDIVAHTGTGQRTVLARVYSNDGYTNYVQFDINLVTGTYRILGYGTWAIPGGDPTGVSTSDTSGTFLFRRLGKVCTLWYWNDSQSRYEWDGDTDGFSWEIPEDDVFLRMGSYIGSTETLTVDFDNIKIYYGDITTWRWVYDSLSFTEVVDATIVGAQQTADVDESLTLTETLLADLDSLVTDALSLSETFGFGFGTTIEDSLSLSENITTGTPANVDESLTFTEDFDFAFTALIEDTLSFVTQALVAGDEHSILAEDGDVLTTETGDPIEYEYSVTWFAGPHDTLVFSEQFDFDTSYTQLVTETLAFIESFKWDLGGQVNESLTLADTAVFGFGTTVAESVTFTDSALFDAQANVSDSLSITDSALFSISLLLNETLTFAEEFFSSETLQQSESFTLTDQTDVAANLLILVQDTLLFYDAVHELRSTLPRTGAVFRFWERFEFLINKVSALEDTISLLESMVAVGHYDIAIAATTPVHEEDGTTTWSEEDGTPLTQEASATDLTFTDKLGLNPQYYSFSDSLDFVDDYYTQEHAMPCPPATGPCTTAITGDCAVEKTYDSSLVIPPSVSASAVPFYITVNWGVFVIGNPPYNPEYARIFYRQRNTEEKYSTVLVNFLASQEFLEDLEPGTYDILIRSETATTYSAWAATSVAIPHAVDELAFTDTVELSRDRKITVEESILLEGKGYPWSLTWP